jgi:hypothetical protein
VGQPIPNTEFLVGVFPSLGENRREALKIAAGWPRTRRSTPSCRGSRTSARRSWPTSASSCTCGTASAATTSGAYAGARRRPHSLACVARFAPCVLAWLGLRPAGRPEHPAPGGVLTRSRA